VSQEARVGGCMGPWEEGRECVGACVAWCDLFHLHADGHSGHGGVCEG